jgi:hypothetical protein
VLDETLDEELRRLEAEEIRKLMTDPLGVTSKGYSYILNPFKKEKSKLLLIC